MPCPTPSIPDVPPSLASLKLFPSTPNKNRGSSSFSSSHVENVQAEASSVVGKCCSDPQVASAVPHAGRLQLDRPPLSAFFGGLSVHPGQHAAKQREAAACWGRHSHHVSMCPMGTRTTGGVKETRTPSPLLSPPPSLNEPATERSFLDPKKRISWCSFYPVPLNDVSDTISSPRPMLSFALLQLGVGWGCRAMTAHG